MPSISKIKINGTEYEIAGGGSGSVTGVKGNKESTYRTGNVNLTPANIGALPDTTTIPTKTSDLTNDSNFVSDANYVHTDNNYTTTEKNKLANAVEDNPTFTEASTRANIVSGESVSTLFGKIKKWFSDLKAVAFSGSYNDLSDKPTIPDISTKMDKADPTGTGKLSINRKTNTTIGNYSAAFGHDCTASADYSVAMGDNCVASGNGSIAMGGYTIASAACQTALGYFNIEDTQGNYALIVGNGTAPQNRKNAFTVGKNGNVIASGTITDGTGNVLSSKQNTLVSGTNIKTINNQSLLGSGNINIGGGGSVTWGNIGGTLSNQTDLNTALNAKEYKPDVLWTNSSPTSNFGAQTITLSKAISNYSYYEIIYIWSASASTQRCASTGRVPKDKGAIITFGATRNYIRTSDAPLGASITFAQGQYYNTYGGSGTTAANGNCVPYQVLGWK